ncbi:hypothetical protein [Rahnella bonaserana]|jgi:hypothetical protein|uniref:SH3 domain-containing protein n=1 Tax=Rahnella bonaserana TaxID=2816248 RepID=A0ABS6LWF7_9GAMM|nr:hypothetical protein [Rahnella bonaserana]MBU9856417.1 hypothetical protein [Rahnella bonaserana]
MMRNKYFRVFFGAAFIYSSYSIALSSNCNLQVCSGFNTPESFKNTINEGYENLEVTTILNKRYAVATTTNDVNKCSVLFPISEQGISNYPINFHKNPFCNYSVVNGKVVSSWKDGAKWHEDIYEVNNGSWSLFIRDECIGCDIVKRTLYENDKPKNTLLLKDGYDFTKRIKITGVISTEKSMLFKTSNPNNKSKSYLIKGDVFNLIDMSPDGNYYKISYLMKSGKNLEGWISYNDFSIED